MDNFIDKITSRFTGQEAIKANAEAEAQEMRKLKAQAEQTNKALAQYDACMQDMRKLNLRNAESAKAVAELIENAQFILKAIKDIEITDKEINTDEIVNGISDKIVVLANKLNGTDEKVSAITERLESTDKVLAEVRDLLEKGTDAANIKADLEGTVHKENVKVYRNVQAALLEETAKLSEAFKDDANSLKGVNKTVLILVIVTLVVGLGNLGMIIAQMFGMF